MKNKPFITLFSLMSLDGRMTINQTQDFKGRDDFFYASGIREGMYQFEEIATTVDSWNLTTAETIIKTSYNTDSLINRNLSKQFSLVILDYTNLLTDEIIKFMKKGFKELIIFNNNINNTSYKNVSFFKISNYTIDSIMDFLYIQKNVKYLTVQADGNFNAKLCREKIIDRISIVQIPLLIGGKEASNLITGDNITKFEDFSLLVSLELESVEILEYSFLHLNYRLK